MSENKKIRKYMDEIESILCSLEEATLGHFEIDSPFVCYEPNTDKILALPLEHRSVKLFIERLAQEARSRYGTCYSFEKRGYKMGIEESKKELERLREAAAGLRAKVVEELHERYSDMGNEGYDEDPLKQALDEFDVAMKGGGGMMTKETKTEIRKILEFQKGWRYEFDAWTSRYEDFFPVSLVESRDTSESYEMNRAHIFENLDGRFVVVTERGCSCYEPSNAELEFFPTKKKAKESFEAFFKPIMGK